MSELTGGWGGGGAVPERTACTKVLWSVEYETSEVRKPACMSRECGRAQTPEALRDGPGSGPLTQEQVKGFRCVCWGLGVQVL